MSVHYLIKMIYRSRVFFSQMRILTIYEGQHIWPPITIIIMQQPKQNGFKFENCVRILI